MVANTQEEKFSGRETQGPLTSQDETPNDLSGRSVGAIRDGGGTLSGQESYTDETPTRKREAQ
jgi:hypothetical protein